MKHKLTHEDELIREMETLQRTITVTQETHDAEVAHLRASNEKLRSARDAALAHTSSDLGKLAEVTRERDALKRENSRLKRVVRGLRDAFVAATEEDAPTAIPFG